MVVKSKNKREHLIQWYIKINMMYATWNQKKLRWDVYLLA